MKLSDNPIFLTQKRLVHRGGVLAAILIAALIGLSLLSGLIAYRAAPQDFPDFKSLPDAGELFYGWILTVEILVLVIGSFLRITRALGEERKAGLWDSNRLTPLKPGQLVMGYWLGSPLREFYMGVALAVTGLITVWLAQLPVHLWLETQILVFSTALLFGLVATAISLTAQRQQSGILVLVALFVLQLFSLDSPTFSLVNFLLPTYGIAHLFYSKENTTGQTDYHYSEWGHSPMFFGLPIPPILLTLGLQVLVGLFLWRASIRKTANPFQPLILRRDALALFGILLLTQHGLIWNIGRGAFLTTNNNAFLLPAVHCGTLLLVTLIIASASPQPEGVRLKALRQGVKGLGSIFCNSAVSLAFLLTAIAAIISLSQFVRSWESWPAYLIATGNLLAFSLFISLLLEFCRLRYRRRALGFFSLWIFVVCLLPFILAGVFSNETLAKLSLLAPGAVALDGPNGSDTRILLVMVAGHFTLVVILFYYWRQQWKQLLARAA